MGKKTAQKDTIIDITSDSQVNSNSACDGIGGLTKRIADEAGQCSYPSCTGLLQMGLTIKHKRGFISVCK